MNQKDQLMYTEIDFFSVVQKDIERSPLQARFRSLPGQQVGLSLSTLSHTAEGILQVGTNGSINLSLTAQPKPSSTAGSVQTILSQP